MTYMQPRHSFGKGRRADGVSEILIPKGSSVSSKKLQIYKIQRALCHVMSQPHPRIASQRSNTTSSAKPQLLQSLWPWTSRTTKLQPRSIRNPHNLPSKRQSLHTQNRLRNRLSPLAKTPKNNLQLLNLREQPSIPHPTKHITCQLERRIVVLPLRVLEPKVPCRHRDDWVTVRPCHRNMRVVLRGVHVKVMRFLVALLLAQVVIR